jgi:hypothetical protein
MGSELLFLDSQLISLFLRRLAFLVDNSGIKHSTARMIIKMLAYTDGLPEVDEREMATAITEAEKIAGRCTSEKGSKTRNKGAMTLTNASQIFIGQLSPMSKERRSRRLRRCKIAAT